MSTGFCGSVVESVEGMCSFIQDSEVNPKDKKSADQPSTHTDICGGGINEGIQQNMPSDWAAYVDVTTHESSSAINTNEDVFSKEVKSEYLNDEDTMVRTSPTQPRGYVDCGNRGGGHTFRGADNVNERGAFCGWNRW